MASEVGSEVRLAAGSPEETQAVGRILGEHAEPGDVFLLMGELGAGKTCLTQGILWGLGGEEYARSPTFVLICEYAARLTLYHMDLYRLDSIDEVVDLGIDDYFLGDGVCVVEWADKGVDAFDGECLTVRIEDLGGDRRALTFRADAARYSALMDALNERRVVGNGGGDSDNGDSSGGDNDNDNGVSGGGDSDNGDSSSGGDNGDNGGGNDSGDTGGGNNNGDNPGNDGESGEVR